MPPTPYVYLRIAIVSQVYFHTVVIIVVTLRSFYQSATAITKEPVYLVCIPLGLLTDDLGY